MDPCCWGVNYWVICVGPPLSRCCNQSNLHTVSLPPINMKHYWYWHALHTVELQHLHVVSHCLYPLYPLSPHPATWALLACHCWYLIHVYSFNRWMTEGSTGRLFAGREKDWPRLIPIGKFSYSFSFSFAWGEQLGVGAISVSPTSQRFDTQIRLANSLTIGTNTNPIPKP